MSRDLTAAEELYERLETLSKELEGSDRIDAHENRDAYPTILDAMNFVCAQASPAPEPVARVISTYFDQPVPPHVVWLKDAPPDRTVLFAAPPADERVKALEQRAETAEHDLQILTTVVRTGYPPPRAIPMRESAEGAAKIAVERAERVKELEGLLREIMNRQLPESLLERIRAALGGG